MLALIPLLVSLIPEVAKWIGGDGAGPVAQQVVSIAQAALGTSDPVQAAALLGDPVKLAEVRVQLAKIGADQEKAQLDAQTARMTAMLADISSARAHDVDVRKLDGGNNWRADLMLGIVAVTLIASVLAVCLSPNLNQIAVGMIVSISGIMAGCFKDAFGFEFGSSRQSETKTAIIADMGKTMVAAPPPVLAPPPPDSVTLQTTTTLPSEAVAAGPLASQTQERGQ